MKPILLKIFTVLFLIEAVLLFNSFYTYEDEPALILDSTTSIYPLIDNNGTSSKTFIRTLKLKYKDINKRVIRNDSTYYRCAYESRMIFYSSFDTLELNSESRKSCDITAFFNLKPSDNKWIETNHIYFIKVINLNTKYELIVENPQPRYLTNIFIKYDKK